MAKNDEEERAYNKYLFEKYLLEQKEFLDFDFKANVEKSWIGIDYAKQDAERTHGQWHYENERPKKKPVSNAKPLRADNSKPLTGKVKGVRLHAPFRKQFRKFSHLSRMK